VTGVTQLTGRYLEREERCLVCPLLTRSWAHRATTLMGPTPNSPQKGSHPQRLYANPWQSRNPNFTHISQDCGTSGTMNFTPPTPTESCHDEELVSRPSSPTPWEHLMRSTARQPSYQEVRVIFKYFQIETSYSIGISPTDTPNPQPAQTAQISWIWM
jgi:hypothetical protein